MIFVFRPVKWRVGIMHSVAKSFTNILMAATAAVFFATVPCCSTPCRAQENSSIDSNSASTLSAVQEYFADWFPRVTRIQSEQPHWVTPLVTVTPRLEEEYRYEQIWQPQKHGATSDNFGGGKGIELIPFQNVEVILGVPAWIAHNGAIQHANKKKQTKPASDAWADETFLIKYRIVSASEENDNYIVTAFMGFSAPTGDYGNSNRHGIFTPTIAFGKGFGDFDVQSTAGISLPDGGLQRLGMPLVCPLAVR